VVLFLAGAAAALGQELVTQYPRAYVINYNPIIESRSGQRLHLVAGWNNPNTLNPLYVGDLAQTSHDLVRYRLTTVIDADEFPLKADGFRYDDATYMACLASWSGWHMPDGVDYKMIALNFDLARRVDLGEIDEVLVQGAPYFGYWESTMAGFGGYWCNSGPQPRIACSRIFIMMGFNYERWIGEMLEDYGHRTESILWRTYGSWAPLPTHAWNRFTLYDKVAPGQAACGNVHYAPNSQSDYDWGNPTYVWSYCDDWLDNYPHLTGQQVWVNRDEWGGGDIRQHHKWWFEHIPHVAGSTTEFAMTRLNNWWEYMQNFNAHAESGGDHLPGGTPPPATPYGRSLRNLSLSVGDDWRPQISRGGWVVWSGSDGADLVIFATPLAGGPSVQISNNAEADELPQINAAGRVVWQSFDGRDYEIYTANADGSDLIRLTDNSVQDWHPAISDGGRVVWEGFDGQDFEIFSADADGGDPIQLTSNSHGGVGKPRDDLWPRINGSNRVVWFGYDGGNWEIYSANADGGGLVQISNDAYENEFPQISDGGKVVWHSWHDTGNAEVYMADATGGGVTRLSSNTLMDWYPQVNTAGDVVWMRRSGDWEIIRRTAAGASSAITNNSTHDQYPMIDDDGRIVWQGFDGADWEIYVYDAGTIYQVTANDYDDRAPAILAAGPIAWHGQSGSSASGPTTDIFVTVVLPGDVDHDGDVDNADLQAILDAWASCSGDPSFDPNADFDDSGCIDNADLQALLDHWGV
jgi:hypothetical protein